MDITDLHKPQIDVQWKLLNATMGTAPTRADSFSLDGVDPGVINAQLKYLRDSNLVRLHDKEDDSGNITHTYVVITHKGLRAVENVDDLSMAPALAAKRKNIVRQQDEEENFDDQGE